jgi:Protein of unknown function (DUF3225)
MVGVLACCHRRRLLQIPQRRRNGLHPPNEMKDGVGLPEVEIEAGFRPYEQALVGYAATKAFRAGRSPGGLEPTLSDAVITTYGATFRASTRLAAPRRRAQIG